MTTATTALEIAARSRVVINLDLELIRAWLRVQGLPFEVRRGLQLRERQLEQFLAEPSFRLESSPDTCHPGRGVRFDGIWSGDDPRAALTCSACGSSFMADIRDDVRRRVLDGGDLARDCMSDDTPSPSRAALPAAPGDGTPSAPVRVSA